MIHTRFAPSPTGPLHLGHAYSAIIAHDFALSHGGEFSVRIEDLDQSRSRPKWDAQIFEDLAWLGLSWNTPVVRQSERAAAYDAALGALNRLGLTYHCQCSRRDIADAANAPQEGQPPAFGPDGLIYPGTCRDLALPKATGKAVRLNMKRAVALCPPRSCAYGEIGPSGSDPQKMRAFSAQHAMNSIGDVVIARRDMVAAYHLAVVVDDAAQGITHVVRGSDLRDATDIHVVLQQVLNLPTPTYYHHDLIRDDAGKRLAKRDDARAISTYRDAGYRPADIRRVVGLA